MIVRMNEANSDKYISLFTEAYKFLESLNNGSVASGKERFSSLAEYYGHIAKLFDQQKYEYIMVPLDEDPFKIDLNTRQIEVPKSFSKCASVQTDLLAETIIFESDRYFDYMDLANTEIYVQWTTVDGVKGATRVEMRDINSEPGKIKFAWPLNDAITAIPGPVKFAVRFFRISNDNAKELVYSLNTTDAEITIRPALQPNGPSFVETPVSDSLFKKAIIDSNYSVVGIDGPVQPIYAEPGTDITTLESDADGNLIELPETENGIKFVGLKDDTITLYVQAIAADAGEVTYKWYYRASDGDLSDKPYDCENYGAEGVKFGTVNHDAYIETKNPVDMPHARYFTKNGSAYELYTDRPIDPKVTLYEKYSAFTVPTTGTVTGLYHAAAWNTIDASGYAKAENLTEDRFNVGTYFVKVGGNYVEEAEFDAAETYYYKVDKILETPFPTESSTCLLPGPRNIIISKNLANGAILFSDDEETVANVQLDIEIEQDSYNPEVTYAWKSSAVGADKVEASSTVIGQDSSLVVTQPGWYGVEISSLLNRKPETKFSNIIKVTEKPVPPQLILQEPQYESVKAAPVTYSVEVDPAILDVNNLLKSDSISYVWQIMIPDHSWTDLTGKESGITINGNSITINNKLAHTSAAFRCLVINELNGAKAIFDHSGTFAPADDKMGEFKPETPYIYENNAYFDFSVRNY